MNEEKKGSYWKFAVVFVVIVVLALGVFIGARLYEKNLLEQKANDAAEALEKAAGDENQQRAMPEGIYQTTTAAP